MRRAAVVAVLALSLGLLVPPPSPAQDVVPPIPELPEPVATVVAVLAPSVTPLCGTTAVVGFLGPNVLGAAPPEIQEVLTSVGPTLVVLCGALPVDTGGYACGLDGDLLTLLATTVEESAGASVAGILLTALPAPVRILMNQLRNLTDLVPGATSVETAVAGVLQCAEATPEDAGAPPPEEEPSPADPVDPPVVPDVGSVFYAAPPSDLLGPVARPVFVPAPEDGPERVTVTAVVETYGFQYAGVLLVPAALLVGAAFAGSALTRDLRPRRLGTEEDHHA